MTNDRIIFSIASIKFTHAIYIPCYIIIESEAVRDYFVRAFLMYQDIRWKIKKTRFITLQNFRDEQSYKTRFSPVTTYEFCTERGYCYFILYDRWQ
jgi:hypothetical protein